ncbi:MAG: hypothetical protein AAB426_06010 [Myxococcota bacterium]
MLEELQQRRRQREREIAQALASEFGVRRVLIFGSLAHADLEVFVSKLEAMVELADTRCGSDE